MVAAKPGAPFTTIGARAYEQVVRLWDELADFPAGETDAALERLLSRLCDLVGAQSAFWLGTVRLASSRRSDPLRGWRPRAACCLRESAEDEEMYRQLVRQIDRGIVDEPARALMRRAGTWRSARLCDLATPDWFDTSDYRQRYAGRGVRDAVFVACPVTPRAESQFGFERLASSRPFTVRERDLLAYALRGLRWFHRRMLLSRGLIVAQAPLSPAERQIQRLLLTNNSEEDIARALHLTPATTHKYITDLFRRFGVRGRAGFTAVWLGSQPVLERRI